MDETKVRQHNTLASNYIKRIRNQAKRRYAVSWAIFRTAVELGSTGAEEPEYNRDELSYMAAQAVRMDLDKIFES